MTYILTALWILVCAFFLSLCWMAGDADERMDIDRDTEEAA